MATEKKVFEIIKEAGFDPIEDKGIVVKYAPENLSDKIAKFFSSSMYCSFARMNWYWFLSARLPQV